MNYDYNFHELHLNNEVLSYRRSLYSFNEIDFPNESVSTEKVLYHFFNFYEFIFKKVRSRLCEPRIDLFYIESLGDGFSIAV